MTCLEKFYKNHQGLRRDYAKKLLSDSCPDDFGYLEDPEYCIGTNVYGDCNKCWDREIPEEHRKVTYRDYYDVKKENNMTNAKKTKAQLIEELEAANKSKTDLEQQLKDLEKYKQYQDCADELRALHMSFVNAGFSDEQAFTMMQTMLQNAIVDTFTRDLSKAVRRK